MIDYRCHSSLERIEDESYIRAGTISVTYDVTLVLSELDLLVVAQSYTKSDLVCLESHSIRLVLTHLQGARMCRLRFDQAVAGMPNTFTTSPHLM